jgi:hypothetical protein
MTTWIRSFPINSCKSLWSLRNPTAPSQQQLITNFCKDNLIKDCFTTCVVPSNTHDVVSLVFNNFNFVSVQHIDLLLTECLPKATKFLHLAVNKFLVHTEYDQDLCVDQADLDLRLILHWSDHINRAPLVQQYNSNDCGWLGNFMYPVTQVIWPVND